MAAAQRSLFFLKQFHSRVKCQTGPHVEERESCNGETQPHRGTAEIDPNFVREFHGVPEMGLRSIVDGDAPQQATHQTDERSHGTQPSPVALQAVQHGRTDQQTQGREEQGDASQQVAVVFADIGFKITVMVNRRRLPRLAVGRRQERLNLLVAQLTIYLEWAYLLYCGGLE